MTVSDKIDLMHLARSFLHGNIHIICLRGTPINGDTRNLKEILADVQDKIAEQFYLTNKKSLLVINDRPVRRNIWSVYR